MPFRGCYGFARGCGFRTSDGIDARNETSLFLSSCSVRGTGLTSYRFNRAVFLVFKEVGGASERAPRFILPCRIALAVY